MAQFGPLTLPAYEFYKAGSLNSSSTYRDSQSAPAPLRTHKPPWTGTLPLSSKAIITPMLWHVGSWGSNFWGDDPSLLTNAKNNSFAFQFGSAYGAVNTLVRRPVTILVGFPLISYFATFKFGAKPYAYVPGPLLKNSQIAGLLAAHNVLVVGTNVGTGEDYFCPLFPASATVSDPKSFDPNWKKAQFDSTQWQAGAALFLHTWPLSTLGWESGGHIWGGPLWYDVSFTPPSTLSLSTNDAASVTYYSSQAAALASAAPNFKEIVYIQRNNVNTGPPAALSFMEALVDGMPVPSFMTVKKYYDFVYQAPQLIDHYDLTSVLTADVLAWLNSL